MQLPKPINMFDGSDSDYGKRQMRTSCSDLLEVIRNIIECRQHRLKKTPFETAHQLHPQLNKATHESSMMLIDRLLTTLTENS